MFETHLLELVELGLEACAFLRSGPLALTEHHLLHQQLILPLLFLLLHHYEKLLKNVGKQVAGGSSGNVYLLQDVVLRD